MHLLVASNIQPCRLPELSTGLLTNMNLSQLAALSKDFSSSDHFYNHVYLLHSSLLFRQIYRVRRKTRANIESNTAPNCLKAVNG